MQSAVSLLIYTGTLHTSRGQGCLEKIVYIPIIIGFFNLNHPVWACLWISQDSIGCDRQTWTSCVYFRLGGSCQHVSALLSHPFVPFLEMGFKHGDMWDCETHNLRDVAGSTWAATMNWWGHRSLAFLPIVMYQFRNTHALAFIDNCEKLRTWRVNIEMPSSRSIEAANLEIQEVEA